MTEWTQEDKCSFFEFLIDNGTPEDEAVQLTEYKACVSSYVSALAKTVKLGKIVPLHALDKSFELMNKKEKDKYLYNIGFDTKQYTWLIDVSCYTWNGKRECGKVIYGCERSDKVWRTTIVNGISVATIESRYIKDMDTLYTMKSNVSVSKA